jgi:hypothetical protein
VFASGGVVVLPAEPGFHAWTIWWTRATDALVVADELPSLRGLIESFGKARERRRRLARLRRLLVHGGDVSDAERAACAAIGLPVERVDERIAPR